MSRIDTDVRYLGLRPMDNKDLYAGPILHILHAVETDPVYGLGMIAGGLSHRGRRLNLGTLYPILRA